MALDANAPHGGKDLYVSDYMCSNIRRIEMRNTSILVYTLQNSGISRPRGLALLPRPSPQRPSYSSPTFPTRQHDRWTATRERRRTFVEALVGHGMGPGTAQHSPVPTV